MLYDDGLGGDFDADLRSSLWFVIEGGDWNPGVFLCYEEPELSVRRAAPCFMPRSETSVLLCRKGVSFMEGFLGIELPPPQEEARLIHIELHAYYDRQLYWQNMGEWLAVYEEEQ